MSNPDEGMTEESNMVRIMPGTVAIKKKKDVVGGGKKVSIQGIYLHEH